MNKKIRAPFLVLMIAAALLLSCVCQPLEQLFKNTPSSRVTIIQHPQTVMTSDNSLFENADCEEAVYGRRQCSPQSQPGQLGCESVLPPPPILGALDPALPIMLCHAAVDQAAARPDREEYLYNSGCMRPEYTYFIILQNGEYQLIKNHADLKAAYAPIESPGEALSYAAALTGYKALNDLEYDPHLRYLTDELQETYIKEIPGGYLVQLFEDKLCGCGPHPTSSVDIEVGFDGSFKVSPPIPLFEDPDQDTLCAD